MIVHNAYFWLKTNLMQEEIEIFEKGLRSLTELSSVSDGHFGKLANTPTRSVVDKSFSYGLNINCLNVELHIKYQEDPVHSEFLKKCSLMWEKVTVYDFET